MNLLTCYQPRKGFSSALFFSDPFGGIAMQLLSSSSRSYLDDYGLLTDPKYFGEQAKQVVMKSVLLQGLVVLTEYSKHLEKQIEAQERGQEMEEFDFKPSQDVFLEKVLHLSFKAGCNLVVRKIYEAACVANLNIRLADRLTKDVTKSALRKLAKYGSVDTAGRIFFTCCWSGCLRTVAVFTVDCCFALYDNLVGEKKDEKRGSVGDVSVWAVKRLAFHSMCMVWGAAGFALGVMIEPKVVAVWSGAIFEAGAAAVLTPLLLT